MSEENSNSISGNSESENISNIEEEKENNEESKELKSKEENEGVEKISVNSNNENEKKNNNNENLIKNIFPSIKIDSNGKSIFSQISENLYEKYLTTDNNKKLDIYEELTNNDYLNSHNTPKVNKKINKQKYNDMMERQRIFEENRKNKLKGIREQQQIELKKNCTFRPNNKNIEMRDPQIFYEEQQKFLETKRNFIETMSRNMKDKDKDELNKVKLISRNSEQIIQNKQSQTETKEETLNRLMNGKTIFSKSPPIENNEKKIKKTMKELEEYSKKLSSEDLKNKRAREEKKRELKEEMEKEMMSKDLISFSTKKVILNKFINNLQNFLNEMYNKKEDIDLTEEDYVKLLEKLKCISKNNHNNKENENNNNNNSNKYEDELVKLSFSKYLNPNDNKINSNQFIIFALSFLGIYKGNDEPNNNKMDNNKIIQSTTFIKLNLPDFNLEKYNYTNKTTQIIKKKFLPFSSKMLESWNEEKQKQRLEKKQKIEEQENLKNQKIHKKEKSNPNFYLTLNKHLLQKKNYIEKLRKQKEEEEMKQCTFQPNASTRPVNKKEIKAKVEKLYTDGKISYKKKLKKKEKELNENKEIEEKCTFMPEIHPYISEIFVNNPLENDQKLIDEMNKLEKLRNKKKINFNYDNFIPMRFDIEHKTNRDTFSIFIMNKRKKQPSREFFSNDDLNSSSKDSDIKNGVAPLLKVEVNIDDSNNIVKLLIYPGDEPMKIVDEFCEKYNLQDEKKKKLQNIIEEKLSENKNINQ